MDVRKVPERRLVAIAALNGVRQLTGGPVGDVMLFRQVPRPGDVLVVAHAVNEILPLVAALLQVELIVIHEAVFNAPLFGESDLAEANPVSLRVDV